LDLFGVRLVGVTTETVHKLLLTVLFLTVILLGRRIAIAVADALPRPRANRRTVFWTLQISAVVTATLILLSLVSIWFDNPARFTTALGLVSAGLAFALQKVVTSLAGYLVIVRGNTFSIGERITMGGVRGDVISLGFIQTRILEMGEPPSVQSADPAMWVRARQFTGRIVTVTNDKVFDTPIYNYTRDFPFIWEEMRVPISYTADRQKAEQVLLGCAGHVTEDIKTLSDPMLAMLRERYYIDIEDLTPKVFYRLTDNWLELTVRFIVPEHGIRDVKDAMSRAILNELTGAGIEIASATYDVVGFPPLRFAPDTIDALRGGNGTACPPQGAASK
jgi:small-conductance mechanosensitive channel